MTFPSGRPYYRQHEVEFLEQIEEDIMREVQIKNTKTIDLRSCGVNAYYIVQIGDDVNASAERYNLQRTHEGYVLASLTTLKASEFTKNTHVIVAVEATHLEKTLQKTLEYLLTQHEKHDDIRIFRFTSELDAIAFWQWNEKQ